MGHHHHDLAATPGNMLRFAAQGRFDDPTELGFGVLQPPLACRHAFLLLVRLSGLILAGEAVSVKSRAKWGRKIGRIGWDAVNNRARHG
jgi:hypothetical protein